ncbi:MAG: hypothetical protein RMH84_03815 [Sulfolobales archaeon]|nr:hypothetical protein [Sulfolobales archaeon]MCX8208577.1 hypothetical protein [Sulfolobales archaeon]MDW8010700.1 hypothetical protein [Sulfolobales archaeon]
MKLRDSALATLICAALLGFSTMLFSHVIPERIYAPAVAGLLVGFTLTFLVIRFGGGFADIAVIGAVASLLGTLLSTLIYFVVVGLQWQAMGYWSALEYLVMMIRSGVFVVRFLTDFIIGSAALLSSAGLVAVVVVGE